jgi:hypothetical protein
MLGSRPHVLSKDFESRRWGMDLSGRATSNSDQKFLGESVRCGRADRVRDMQRLTTGLKYGPGCNVFAPEHGHAADDASGPKHMPAGIGVLRDTAGPMSLPSDMTVRSTQY